jgi:two-component system, LuxR family, sensor kinase FixL
VLVHDNAVATHLFRIALEAVSNAVRHGQVTQIIIGLATSNGKTRLTITDDGIGLSPGWEDRPGLGLHILHYRARMIGGTLEIRDAPAGGTIISCSAPQKVVC